MRLSNHPTLRVALFILSICVLTFSQSRAATASDSVIPLPYVPGEIVIGWEPAEVASRAERKGRLDVDRTSETWRQAAEDLAARTGLAVLDVQPAYGSARLAVPAGEEEATIRRLSALPWVKYAEPNYIARAAGYPNDPRIGDQWNMRRIGAPAAWDLTFGSYSLVVAVIDSGIDAAHPEFAGRLLAGHNYVNPYASPNDDFGHGTHVTGILAAAANNGIGVAGLAAHVQILPLKVLDAQGNGTYEAISTAIYYATDYGAQVINLSLSGLSDANNLRQAIAYAASHNVFVAAAAGNCAQGGAECSYLTNPNMYPAAYDGVVAVAASDHYDNWANYSGFKPYIALAAPGGVDWDPVWSTVPGSGYGVEFGTSMATPLVSAAAALVLTYMPAATPTQIADILKNTADKVGPYTYIGGRNDWFGAGRLNVAKAVRWAYPPAINPIGAAQRFLLGEPITQTLLALPLINDSDQPATWQATVIEGSAWLRTMSGSGAVTHSVPGQLTLQAGPTALGPGEHDGVVEIRTLSPSPARFFVVATLKVTSSLERQFLPLAAALSRASDWLDPAFGGFPIYPTNDGPYRVGLPFPVTFYGNTHNAISVSFKGYTSFSQPGSGSAVAQSSCLPTAALPNDAIYALWQDWNPALGGQVYIHYPDADRFAITWSQVRRYPGDLPHDFQIIIFRSGDTVLQYRAVQSPTQGTVGIENWDGTVAQQVACQGAGRPPRSGDAISLSAHLPW